MAMRKRWQAHGDLDQWGSDQRGYQILIDLDIPSPKANGWHTLADPVNHPGPFEHDVGDVQIYSLAILRVVVPRVCRVALLSHIGYTGRGRFGLDRFYDSAGTLAGYKVLRNASQTHLKFPDQAV